jgi:hypothetical protein
MNKINLTFICFQEIVICISHKVIHSAASDQIIVEVSNLCSTNIIMKLTLTKCRLIISYSCVRKYYIIHNLSKKMVVFVLFIICANIIFLFNLAVLFTYTNCQSLSFNFFTFIWRVTNTYKATKMLSFG